MTDTPGQTTEAKVYRETGVERYRGFDATTQSYAPFRDNQAVLKRTSEGSYQRSQPDGSTMIYALSDGATTFPRRIYLTEMHDAAGNATTLSYAAGNRLHRVTAADGRWLQFYYGDTASYYRITGVSDDLGRSAVLSYTAGMLTGITDMASLTSTFGYRPSTGAPSDVIETLTTPYGITSFQSGVQGNNRWIEITDSMGGRERHEYLEYCALIANAKPAAPTGFLNDRLRRRNTFHWSKKAMGEMTDAQGYATLDFAKAHITNWLKSQDGTNTSTVVGSTKAPLEGRVWRSYQSQPSAEQAGPSSRPIRKCAFIGRWEHPRVSRHLQRLRTSDTTD